MKSGFRQTIAASFVGYITQAIVNNFAPLLFVTFNRTLGVTMEKIALLITINFGTQLITDYVSRYIVDRFGTRAAVAAAHFFAASGLVMLSFMPRIAGFYGLIFSTVAYAVGGGLIEVLVSPIVEACPTQQKSASMSLLHSFYCWGQLLTILVSTLFFSVFGIANWGIISLIWAVIPLLNGFWFLKVPINDISENIQQASVKQLFSSKMLWTLLLLMVCSGASELGMSQWASAFAEDALGISKTAGDLAGPCLFALLMGISRIIYAVLSKKVSITTYMILSCILCVASYLTAALSQTPALSLAGCAVCGFAVGIMWPGTYSLAAAKLPTGGVALFSSLALAGDLGCTSGPAVIGLFSKGTQGLKAGMLCGSVFPAIMLIGIFTLILIKKPVSKQARNKNL